MYWVVEKITFHKVSGHHKLKQARDKLKILEDKGLTKSIDYTIVKDV